MAAKKEEKKDASSEHEHDGQSSLPPLTARNLLDLCSLPSTVSKKDHDENRTSRSSVDPKRTRHERIQILNSWQQEQPERLSCLLLTEQGVDSKSGCFPLHWAAGTGFDEAVQLILDEYNSSYPELLEPNNNHDDNNHWQHRLVNQLAHKPSTGRTPLHYAARNGHVTTCQLLIEGYGAHANPPCHRGSVTPLQLAVWQNRLPVVKYLVSANANRSDSIVLEKNDFQCGLNHWIGLIPKHRWGLSDNDSSDGDSDNGSGVLPLARYLESCGVSYASLPQNQQNQGHTPLHKAAWGGNMALMEYYRNEHQAYDTVQDTCGNYAADLARMAGHTEAQEWLYQHGSLDRQASCAVLGVDVTATPDEIRARYKQLAKHYHPDRYIRGSNQTGDDDKEQDDFMKIKAAYEHLIHQGGVGTQANPKYEALKLLTASVETTKKEQSTGHQNTPLPQDEDDLFQARILAILSDYGDKGFPISAIAKRWNQVWPEQPFPSPEDYVIEVTIVVPSSGKEQADGKSSSQTTTTTMVPKRVKLLKFLKWKCRGVCYFRKVNGVELAFQKDTPTTSSQNHVQNNTSHSTTSISDTIERQNDNAAD